MRLSYRAKRLGTDLIRAFAGFGLHPTVLVRRTGWWWIGREKIIIYLDGRAEEWTLAESEDLLTLLRSELRRSYLGKG